MSYRINVLASWGAHAVVLLTGLILTPYILETVGKTTYGGWLLLNAIAGYSRLLYLGFGETICRYVAKHAADEDWESLNRVASCTFAIYLASATVALAAGLLLAAIAPSIDKLAGSGLPMRDVRIALVLLGLNASVSISGSVFGGLLMGLQRFDLERGTQTVVTLARLVLTLILLQHEQGLVTLAAIFLAVSTLEVSLMFAFARRLLPGLRIRPSLVDRATLRETTGFSVFTSTAVISEQLVYATDAIVIGLRLNLVAVVTYGIAHRICEMMRQPIHQVGIVSLPRAGQLHTNEAAATGDDSGRGNRELNRFVLGSMSLSMLLAAGSLIGAAFFGDLLIRAWMPDDYDTVDHTQRLLLWLVAAQVIALPVGIMRKSLVGIGFVKIPAMLVLGGAIANLILSLLLVGPFGVDGVAYGTLIPIVLVDGGLLLPIGLRRLGIAAADAVVELVGRNLLPLAALWGYCYAVSQFRLPETLATIAVVAAIGGLIVFAIRFGPAAVRHPKQVLSGGLE